MTDYAQLLKTSGLKSTFQRMNILENIETYGHMSIDEIYAKISIVHPSLSLATVYKNIILMLDNDVLTEVCVLGKKSKYELKKEEHIHFVCTVCEHVEDRPHDLSIDGIFENISKRDNFLLSVQQINLYGVCSSCQMKVAS
ncbi:MAG: transcriptional repressor [Epsilonproteobacteria bacterium]|nr:MAG: transcriptional repressor [Campylobacterota bacterium]